MQVRRLEIARVVGPDVVAAAVARLAAGRRVVEPFAPVQLAAATATSAEKVRAPPPRLAALNGALVAPIACTSRSFGASAGVLAATWTAFGSAGFALAVVLHAGVGAAVFSAPVAAIDGATAGEKKCAQRREI